METKKDLEINGILDLQIALMEDNNSAIKGYIERLDRETSNAAMRQADEHFGFPIVEIEGVVRTSLGHLARVFGYKAPRSLKDLLERRGIEGINIGGFEHNTQIKIQNELGLETQDRKSILYDWPAFLIGGMNSTNDEARIVQTYLLRMERIARVGIVAVKTGQLRDNLPEPVHAMVKCKLAKEAWRGNPMAAYILEHDYGIPVNQLLHRTDPELSELAGTIVQYLYFVAEERLTMYGLKTFKNDQGLYVIRGLSSEFYTTFLEVARRHHLHRFFGNNQNFGCTLSKEADAIEILGWKRSILPGKQNGYYIYQFEQCRNVTAEQSEATLKK